MKQYYSPKQSYRQYKPYKQPWKKVLGIFRRKQITKPLQGGRSYLANNPWRKEKKSVGKKVWLTLLFIVIIIWLALIAYLPYFQIKSVTFNGLKIIKEPEISTYVRKTYLTGGWLIPANNYFRVSASSITDDLMKQFSVKSVQVVKNFPNGITINIEEKISSIIYDNGFGYYLLDNNGGVIKVLQTYGQPPTLVPTSTKKITMATPTSTVSTTTTEHLPDFKEMNQEYGPYPVLFDMRKIIVTSTEQKILNNDVIAAAINWTDLMDRGGVTQVQFITMENPATGLRLYTNRGWSVLVNLDADPASQLENLKIILKDHQPAEYIDVRYGERVFWK